MKGATLRVLIRPSRQSVLGKRAQRELQQLAENVLKTIEPDRYELVQFGFSFYVFDKEKRTYRNMRLHLRELAE